MRNLTKPTGLESQANVNQTSCCLDVLLPLCAAFLAASFRLHRPRSHRVAYVFRECHAVEDLGHVFML